jgi:hypothetical protein
MTNPTPTGPEIRRDLPARYYREWDLISNSGMGLLKKAPARYDHERKTPKPVLPIPPTIAYASRDIGTVAHVMALEPENLADHAICLPALEYRKKEDKETLATIRTDNPGKVLMRPVCWEMARQLADAMLNDDVLGPLLAEPGDVELSLAGHLQSKSGAKVLTKGRIDKLIPSMGVVLDLKTARSADPVAFAKAIYEHGYYRQAAVYCDLEETLRGWTPEEYVIGVVEKDEPYMVAVYVLDGEAIEAGRKEYRYLLDVYRECMESGKWPGYGGGKPMNIGLPPWAMKLTLR